MRPQDSEDILNLFEAVSSDDESYDEILSKRRRLSFSPNIDEHLVCLRTTCTCDISGFHSFNPKKTDFWIFMTQLNPKTVSAQCILENQKTSYATFVVYFSLVCLPTTCTCDSSGFYPFNPKKTELWIFMTQLNPKRVSAQCIIENQIISYFVSFFKFNLFTLKTATLISNNNKIIHPVFFTVFFFNFWNQNRNCNHFITEDVVL